MSKKTAELSAGLVAVKGQAAPANDMRGRAADGGKPTETGQTRSIFGYLWGFAGNSGQLRRRP